MSNALRVAIALLEECLNIVEGDRIYTPDGDISSVPKVTREDAEAIRNHLKWILSLGGDKVEVTPLFEKNRKFVTKWLIKPLGNRAEISTVETSGMEIFLAFRMFPDGDGYAQEQLLDAFYQESDAVKFCLDTFIKTEQARCYDETGAIRVNHYGFPTPQIYIDLLELAKNSPEEFIEKYIEVTDMSMDFGDFVLGLSGEFVVRRVTIKK